MIWSRQKAPKSDSLYHFPFKNMQRNMMAHIALISFLANSINTRILSSYLKLHGYSVCCYFCEGKLTTENLNSLVTHLKEKNTSLVGVSLVTDDYQSAVHVTRAVKQALGVQVVWGGAHVNIMPEESLRHADMICLGEGEEALLELVESFSHKGAPDTSIRNIWFKTSGGIVKNELRPLEENLDKYPFPDFDLSTQYIMADGGFENFSEKRFGSEYSIMTSRGCPYSCHYCYNSYRWKQYSGKGKYLRARSIENVIQELVQAKKLFGNVREINFWDDSFVARKSEDFLKFKELYLKHVNLPFFALIEPMAYNAEKIKILHGSGLRKLQVGIQSGSERVNAEVYNRPVSSRKVLEVAESIRELGIEVIYDLIFNNPYEKLEDLYETQEILLKFPRPFNLQGYNLIFYPGTEMTTRALKDGFISLKENSEDFSTIQGKGDAPTMLGHAEVSSRFYAIEYSSDEKVYPNAVISLFAYQHVPLLVIRYFAGPETRLKRLQLRLFGALYILASRIKNSIIPSSGEGQVD